MIKGVKCLECEHLLKTINGFIPTCKAFPKGIPDYIFWNEANKEECNNGIGFEQKMKSSKYQVR